ncbi:DNA polymerase III, psi subunit [Candidatus Blochmanniella floridana]|uniref:DNA polymerase III subunit psi n=1 Tax=Blochmanniella floridana TaxID=203907 RepID=Q7VQL8_BLOFL|nr:DNA polymerase III, psi subunit [Candidatus Blochmannia floridanus]
MNVDVVLKRLDITLWKIRYPAILKKSESVQLLINLRFLIISGLFISLDDPFVQDVIRAMRVKNIEVYIININEINNLILPVKVLNYCWWVGVEVLCDFGGISLCTESLNVLKYDMKGKQDFWYQIYRNVYCDWSK